MNKSFTTLLVSFVLVSAGAYSSTLYAALSCDAMLQSNLDWDDPARDWPDPTPSTTDYMPTLSHSENVDGIDFNFAFSSDQSEADLIWSMGRISNVLVSPDDLATVVGPGDLDGDGVNDEGLLIALSPAADGTDTPIDMDVILTTTLSSPVSQFEFTISDVDYSLQDQIRQDQVTIVGSYEGNTVLPILTAVSADPTFTITGNVATAIEADNRDAHPEYSLLGDLPAENGLLLVTFDQPIDSFAIIYSDADETVADGDVGGTRGISMLNDFSFCPAPDLLITKTDNEADYTPGEPFSYTIVITNDGVGAADGSSFNDVVPSWGTNVTYECTAEAGGAICPSVGPQSGNTISELIATLPDGGSLTYTVTGIYSPDMADYP